MTSLGVGSVLGAFASDVGPSGPVCVAGGRTQWTVGGLPALGTRQVVAPAGVVAHEPAEMIVRVRAGTVVSDLNTALAESGQMVPLDPAHVGQATVGGVLAVGHSGPRRLRYGPLRDYVLEVQSVSAEGRLVKAGGPVVKNVTGFDLCRLLVGSLGTVGLLAEVVLRCYPIPEVSQWYAGRVADPIDLSRRLYRASSMLYDGDQLWVLLEGHPADVKGQAASVLGPAFSEVGGPPPLPEGRLSVAPSALGGLADLGGSGSGGSGSGGSAALGGSGSGWVAELGVGVVHASEPDSVAAAVGVPWPPAPPPGVAALNAAVKARFDPTGRLNPGRQVP